MKLEKKVIQKLQVLRTMLFNIVKIKRGDIVKVLIGKDKGKTGKIDRVFPERRHVLVDGVNQYKKHVKARVQNPASQQGGQKSEIITITKTLPVSSVAIICPKCKKPTRIGRIIEKGKKVRICRKCLKTID